MAEIIAKRLSFHEQGPVAPSDEMGETFQAVNELRRCVEVVEGPNF